MSISIKSFMMTPDGREKEEIRRFAIDNDVSTNFLYLQEKLMKIYTTLTRGEFSVHWKDEEGDFIVISSDEELMSALTSTKEDLHKLYIIRGRLSPSSNDSSAEIHPRVTCDGCQGAIKGFRYKCMECADYDLCAKCEGATLHSHHVMVRLPKPVDKHNAGSVFPWLFGRHFGRHGRNGHGHCPRGDPRKSHRHHEKAGQEGAEQAGAGAASGSNAYPFQFQQVLEKIWTVLGGLPKDKETNESGTEGSSDEKQGGKPTVTPEQQQEAFLKRVGETVAQFLDPLGIDVDIGVEHNGRYTNVNNPPSSKPTPQSAPGATGGDIAPSDAIKILAAAARQRERLEAENAAIANAEVLAALQRFSEAEAEAEFDRIAAASDTTVQTPPSDTTVQTPPSATAELASAVGKRTPDRASPTLNGNEDANDWTYIGDKEKEQIPKIPKFQALYPQVPPQPAAEAVAELGGVRPRTTAGPPTSSLAQEEMNKLSEVQHPNPVIRSALKQMTSMGFSNEGGWLTQLLEVKNGNIDSVLEVLAPQRPL